MINLDTPYVSNSMLSYFDMLLHNKENDTPPVYVFNYGKLVDAMITDPQRVDPVRRMLKPDLINYPDEKPVFFDYEQWAKAEQNKNAFFNNPLCASIHSQSTFQVQSYNEGLRMQYKMLDFTIPSSCRWDLYNTNIPAELKTTSAKTQKDFEIAIDTFNYDRAAWWYLNTAGLDKMLIIGIHKTTSTIFFVKVTHNSYIYRKGEEKAKELAWKYWMYFL